MNAVRKAIIPGLLIGILILFGLSRLVMLPTPVSAATETASNQQADLNSCVFAERYPAKTLPWCSLIEKAAAEYGVDALLISAVMLMESGGQPEVMSGSGAMGLMQVMPRDGIASSFQCINGPCFANRPTIQELKDPAFNVDYGVRMLAGLIAKYGDIRDALKHYGPYDVDYQYADKVLAIRNGL
jgi:soluble lytic murein transglycosylase-like protein